MPVQRTRAALVALVLVALVLVLAGCAQPTWVAGSARADLRLRDGTGRTFAGGTCERGSTDDGRDYFVLSIGRPSRGESAAIRVELDLVGGAAYAGDGSGEGVEVNHDGSRWGLAESPIALRFNPDVTGGLVQLVGLATAESDADPRLGMLLFTC